MKLDHVDAHACHPHHLSSRHGDCRGWMALRDWLGIRQSCEMAACLVQVNRRTEGLPLLRSRPWDISVMAPRAAVA
jgi:hypothetical protein